ncbi:MAG: hypothetical protein H6Q16_1378 [Bacteroidetes bacterium]|nr:hypothetical protein [Bacteroidota bacterium]
MNLRKFDAISIETCENFPKQTFRNRTYILSANGVSSINVPLIQKTNIKQKTSEIRISYTENWNIRAWRTITSAYGKSIYFEYFEDDIKKFFTNKYEKLIDLNLDILYYFINKFDINTKIEFTKNYNIINQDYDFRNKLLANKRENGSNVKFTPYIQCFSDKFPFKENLSCIDLLMNTGKESNLIINF